MKGQSLCYLIPRVVGRRRPPPSEICAQSDPPRFEKRLLRPISAHNVSTVGDSEQVVQLWQRDRASSAISRKRG